MSAEVGSVKYKVELDDSSVDKQADSTQNKLTSKLGGAAKKVGTAALAASAAVASAATAAVVDLTKQAVSAYADFEQLTGGVETLFGDAADYVELKAANAFSTAGLSANEYMETVTGFSASLIQSLGGDTEKAAQLADQAIVDMSDNANKMGSSMESIQNAYQGFAKQNYTMLDNLKLGYGGTKEEMARLLEDAEKISGIKYDISSYADVVNAIHVMQESMGIAGTTAEEAATTISGSLGMVSAAWQNVVTDIASGNSDRLSDSVNDLVYSVGKAAENLLPVIENALTGISEVVAKLAPQIAEKLPAMITDALPSLASAAKEAISALAHGLIEAFPSLMPTVVDLIMELGQMIIEMAPDLVKCGIDLIVQLAMGLVDALPELIPAVVEAIITIVETLIDNIDMLIDAAIAIIMALSDGLIEALPRLIEKAPEIIIKLVEALIRNYPKIVEAGFELITKLIEGILKSWTKCFEVGRDIVDKVKSGFSDKVKEAKTWGSDMIQNFIDGIMAKFDRLKASVKKCAQAVKDFLGFSEPAEGPLSNFHTFAPDMLDLYAKGIDDNIDTVENSVENVAKSVAGTFNADIGYNLPDIAGYAADLSAMITASNSTEIIVPLNVDGREIARASAWYMNEQLAWEAR